jgi:hypothetical protein
MERDPVSFRIDDHRAKAVLADFLPRSQNFSAIGAHGFDCFV